MRMLKQHADPQATASCCSSLPTSLFNQSMNRETLGRFSFARGATIVIRKVDLHGGREWLYRLALSQVAGGKSGFRQGDAAAKNYRFDHKA